MSPLPVGEIVQITIHGARVAGAPSESGWQAFEYGLIGPGELEHVTLHAGSAAVTVTPVRDLPPGQNAAQHRPGPPPDGSGNPWGALAVGVGLLAAIVVFLIICGWAAG